jgi:hypothetical protein
MGMLEHGAEYTDVENELFEWFAIVKSHILQWMVIQQ